MAFPTPRLDDRTFDQLVDEALARIPRYAPEWTNHNESDPGIAIVKLHAWLTETLLFQLNRLPERAYAEFLDLLDVRPRPATPARADLTVTLAKLNGPDDPLAVLVPKGAQVQVDDPDLAEPLVFETDRTLRAVNALVALLAGPGAGGAPTLLSTYDPDEVSVTVHTPFYPFGPEPVVGDTLTLGLLLRPHRQPGTDYALDRFPEGELDLAVLVPQVYEVDAGEEVLEGPMAETCRFAWEVEAEAEGVVWEAFTGPRADDFSDPRAWRPLGVVDATAGLVRSGHVSLEVPAGLPTVRFDELDRTAWAAFGLLKPPTTYGDLNDDLNGGLPDVVIEQTDALRDALCQILGTGDDDPWAALTAWVALPGNAETAIDAELLTEEVLVEAGYDPAPVADGEDPPQALPLTWFRARLAALPDRPPQISALHLNTVAATAAVTRVEETLGFSDGQPGQTAAVRHTPLLVDEETGAPDLDLRIEERGGDTDWTAVSDFYGVGPEDAVFVVEPQTGTLQFGDGRHGRIPLAGARIVAERYRYGGGSVGNAGRGTITKLKSALPDVAEVTNARAASGGGDAEPLEEVMLRAPHTLRTRERAVAASDFAELAARTPGVRIQRAYALALHRPTFEPDGSFELVDEQPGAVTVVVLPDHPDEDRPQPTEAELRRVCAHLDTRRLITTELYVVGPRYTALDRMRVELRADPDADLRTVTQEATDALLAYFHPLTGGEDGRGWPFGGDVTLGGAYRQVLGVAGVRRVECVEIEAGGTVLGADAGVPCHVLSVPPGHLVSLPREALDLRASYDREAP